MELLTILNRCHHFRGFVYDRARFSPDRKSIEVLVRPRKGSAAICSRCHQAAPGYDQLGYGFHRLLRHSWDPRVFAVVH